MAIFHSLSSKIENLIAFFLDIFFQFMAYLLVFDIPYLGASFTFLQEHLNLPVFVPCTQNQRRHCY